MRALVLCTFYRADFRGSPDPLHGDTYNDVVRTSASELMDELFSTSNSGSW